MSIRSSDRKSDMKHSTFVAFDVETPNYANNRMSSLGISVVEYGSVTEEFYSLIDPQTHFDSFNIRLTGISPALVRGQPDFGALWERIEPLMSRGILVAHNASFDMGVLSHCLQAYGIDWKQYAPYVCTCVMGRACYPELEHHKLDTMCSYLNISLEHHNAGSDARACAQLLLNYLQQGLNVDRYLRRYDFDSRRTLR